MKISSELITRANTAITATGGIVNENGTYDKEYNGYISSFGAAVVQSGLLPAVIFFENEDGNTDADRAKIIKAIRKVLDYENCNTIKLANYIINSNKSNDSTFLREVTSAAVAIKLALRMYKKVDKKQK